MGTYDFIILLSLILYTFLIFHNKNIFSKNPWHIKPNLHPDQINCHCSLSLLYLECWPPKETLSPKPSAHIGKLPFWSFLESPSLCVVFLSLEMKMLAIYSSSRLPPASYTLFHPSVSA